jgi:hypothetical protein
MRIIPLNGGCQADTLTKAMQAVPSDDGRPHYVLMFGERHFDERLARLSAALGPLAPVTAIHPSFPDRLLYWINPTHNKNETCWVYRLAR